MELGINLDEIPERENQEYAPLAEGDYTVACIDTNYKTTKAGDGKYLSCKFQILSGNSKGRIIWENMNLVNPSEDAVKIGRGKIKELSKAIGLHGTLNDSIQLHDQPLIIRLGLNKKGEIEVKKFMSINEAPAQRPVAKTVPVKEETVQKKPWE
jgi:hypothetical protein